ncbi:MAG: hypothetical protein IPJ19_19250 [Planctomycetes bacterium]|nr:hypothetical protein [Planctomycetota bacterium]
MLGVLLIACEKREVEPESASAAAPAVSLQVQSAPPVSAALPQTSSAQVGCSRTLTLDYGVMYDVSVYVGAATRWVSDGNPLFEVGSFVRPVSIMAVATWKDTVVSTTHLLYWRGIGSAEGLGSSITVLGAGFSEDAGVPPRSQLTLDVRPIDDWGKVGTENDLLPSAQLELKESHPLQNPTPMVPAKK